jgi:hypothetical protein
MALEQLDYLVIRLAPRDIAALALDLPGHWAVAFQAIVGDAPCAYVCN